jgi:hypothetical protein
MIGVADRRVFSDESPGPYFDRFAAADEDALREGDVIADAKSSLFEAVKGHIFAEIDVSSDNDSFVKALPKPKSPLNPQTGSAGAAGKNYQLTYNSASDAVSDLRPKGKQAKQCPPL